MSFNGKASGENTLKATIGVYNTINGKSAYEIAVINGFNGSEEDWLESLKGYALTSQDKQDIAELTIEDVIKIKDDYEAGLNDAKSKFESSLKNAINNEKAERQDEIAVERKRIDTLVAAPTLGSTDTELYDARVDFTGYRWQSAGHAMREGDAKLKRKIESIEGFVQPLPVENTLNRSYLNNGVWEVEEDTDYATIVYDLTPYAGRKIRCTVDGANMSAYDTRISYALYDSFGNIIQSGNPTEDAMGFVGYDFWLDIPFNADRVPVTRTGNFILCIPIDYGSGVNFFLEPLFELAKSVSRLRKLVPNVDEILIVGSTNPITSNAVAEAIDDVRGEIPAVDEVVTYGSKNPVSGDAVYNHVSSSMSSAQNNAVQISRLYVDDRIGDIDFSELQEQIDNLGFIDINALEEINGWISSGNWSPLSGCQFKLIPVKPGERVNIIRPDGSGCYSYIAYLTDYSGVSGAVSFVEGTSKIEITSEYEADVPSGTKYLWLCTLCQDKPATPKFFTIDGYNVLMPARDNIGNKVNKTELEDVETAIKENESAIAENKSAIAETKNILGESIENVRAYVDEQTDSLTCLKSLEDYPRYNGNIMNTNLWGAITDSYQHIVIPVVGGEQLIISKKAGVESYIACVKSYTPPTINGSTIAPEKPDFVDETGWTGKKTVGTDVELTVPLEGKFLIVGVKHVTYGDITPSKLILNGYDYLKSARTHIEELEGQVTEINKDVVEVNGNLAGLKDDIAAFGNVTESLNDTFDGFAVVPQWVRGGFNMSGTGAEFPHDARKRTDYMTFRGSTKIVSDGKYTISVGYFENGVVTKTFIMNDVTNSTELIPPSTTFRLMIQDANDSTTNLTAVTSEEVNSHITITCDGLKNVLNPNIRWCAMGDSITDGWYSYYDETTGENTAKLSQEKGWAFKLAERKRWGIDNKAVGGSGYMFNPSEKSNRSGWGVAQATDFTKYDLVTLAYGVNDWNTQQPLGTMDDDFGGTPNSICGAMRKTIETIIASNPLCKIVVITPLNCWWNESKEENNWALGCEWNGITLEDVFSVEKEVCEYYGIEMIDMTHSSIVNRKNIKTLLLDGVHPTAETHTVMARELGAKINFS